MKQSSHSQPKWVNKLFLVFLVIFTAILYLNLGRDALFDWDEGIYAELGRQLLLTKNLFITSWNGSPWFEKPPGIAWLSGLGQLFAGHSSLGARLFQPMVASSVLYLVFLIGSKFKSWRTGLLAAGILASFNLFLGRTRAVNTDMPLLLGITGTITALLYNKKPVLVALIIALSVWFKGLAGLLPALIAAPLFFTKSKKYFLLLTAYCILFIVPWHLFMYFGYGEAFLTPYFKEQVLARATNPIEFHLESRWFYFKYLYENLGLGVLMVAGVGALLSLKSKKYFPVWWMLIPLALFTLAKTRLFWYILPIYPALALLVAYAIDYFSVNKTAKKIITIIALGVCLQSLTLAWRSVEPQKKSVIPPDRINLVVRLSKSTNQELFVLVPKTERTAEAILPLNQRISSSFRYGGMPSIVYYYQGPVKFFYNVDEFNISFANTADPVAMVHRSDLILITSRYRIVEESGEYLGIRKGLYAQR